MDERGLNQAEVARMLHTPASTLTKWRAGSQPQRNTLIALSKALGVSLPWLAKGEGKMLPEYEKNLAPDEKINRLEEMGYQISGNQSGEDEALESILEVMSMDLLLDIAERVRQPSGVKALLGEVRRRTAASDKVVSYLPNQPTKQKP